MSEESRRIVAMLFSDIVGYTAAMGSDEETAIRVVSRSREIQKEFVGKFDGQWLQEIGDGVMCSFESAVKAVGCALEIQRALKDDAELNLAIGIHVGDVVFRKTDIGFDVFGDAVNVAARVQSVAGPGGVTISERVYYDMRNHKGMEFEFIGEKQLKNVNRPIRIYNLIDRESLGDAPPPPTRMGKAAEQKAADSDRRLVPAVVALVVLLAVAAFFLLRSEFEAPREVADSTAPGTPAPTTSVPAGAPVAKEAPAAELSELEEALTPSTPRPVAEIEAGSFDAVRKALLGAAGPWGGSGVRVWTEPNPVPNDATYVVRFEAQCDCAVLIFSVDGSGDDISLLYPNPFEQPDPLTAGETIEIPSSSDYSLRAVGGEGMDLLKIFVSPEDFRFPPNPAKSWYVTPEEPERLAELAAFLEVLGERRWDSAATPLHIVK
jgi:class 3 adenylate cyclase